MSPGSSTPLIALEAVVFDTETTGLDTASARLVQIGALTVASGELVAGEEHVQLVDPHTPIPEASSGIHGITDEMVRGAPSAAEAIEGLRAFVGERVTVGHTTGFDLAIFQAEARRAGTPAYRPRGLDTRLLAEVANPALPGYSLDMVAAWLGVPVEGRHSALGDARITARVFLGLLPHLAARGVRTLAQADAACRRLTRVLDDQVSAGWVEPPAVAAGLAAEGAFARIDTYPYRHRVGEIMTPDPVLAGMGDTLGTCAARMGARRMSSLFLQEGAGTEEVPASPPQVSALGIITERDVLRALSAYGAAALDMPAGRFMSRPLVSVPAEAFLYRALGRMADHGLRHLAVADEGGALVGVVAARDLLRLRAGEALSLGDEIDQAETVAQLALAWARLPQVAASLLGEEVGVNDIVGVISREVGALVRSAGRLAEAEMIASGAGGAPVPYALLLLGSAGRGECLLNTDQDTALVYAEAVDREGAEQWFAAFGARVGEILDAAGLPRCPGGVMMARGEWRGSINQWCERIDLWLSRSQPQDVLNVGVFFDLRPVGGTAALAEDLIRTAYARARGRTGFARMLAGELDSYRPPLTLFRRLKTEEGQLDLKRSVLFPVAVAARTLAIHQGVLLRETPARLAAIGERHPAAASDLAALARARDLALRLLLRAQLDAIAAGASPGEQVSARELSRSDAAALRGAVQTLAPLPEILRGVLANP